MALEYLAGQILTADELQKSVPHYLELGTDHDISSSTTLEETDLAVTVDDLMKISLDIRYTTSGGGIRWAWSDTGSVTLHSRAIHSPGEDATGDSIDISDMRLRSVITFGEEQTITDFTGFTSQRLTEELIVSGEGTVTFAFAQDTSDASATTLDDQSYVIYQYLAD